MLAKISIKSYVPPHIAGHLGMISKKTCSMKQDPARISMKSQNIVSNKNFLSVT